jgi:uncharacterized membrane protein
MAPGAGGHPSFDGSGDGDQLDIDEPPFSASLPSPSEFAGYESILPGASRRILRMAEESNAAQNEALTRTIDAEVRFAKRNQYIALLLILLGFAASIVFFALDDPLAGFVYVCIPIAVLLRSPREPSDEG